MQKKICPFGLWPSTFAANDLVAGQKWLSQIQIENDTVYWHETRPSEKGRATIVRLQQNQTADLVPTPYNVRSRVHEYGGACYAVKQGTLYFVNDLDQQIYIRHQEGNISQLTHAPQFRFADIILPVSTTQQNPNSALYLICVAEQHTDESTEPLNSLVKIDLISGQMTTIQCGDDFYASPCLNNDATKLSWISWNHPDMPWSRSQLWVANCSNKGDISDTQCLRSGNESIFQPQWSADGELYFVSDISGWWNIYNTLQPDKPIISMHAEFAKPLWNLGLSTYAFIDKKNLVCTYLQNGYSTLATINLDTFTLSKLATSYSHYDSISANNGKIYYIASSVTDFDSIRSIDFDTQLETLIMRSSDKPLAAETISLGQGISFKSSENDRAYAFFYLPVNPEYKGADNEKPPLIVISHGGPTSFSTNSLSLKIQFWTSRGFAVVDVNYRGSTGFGRQYRNALNGKWGEVDVADCINAAIHLSEQGLVDKERLIIRGSSAGGYTTLAALTFSDVFKAGASYYGISDLCTLAEDTHKFEARYLDNLVGPWPKEKALYEDRSPINSVDKLNCPIIFFQGLKDKVVPPSQAERMVRALQLKGLNVAYETYTDEAHGFRQAETIAHSLETELKFYTSVFKFNTHFQV